VKIERLEFFPILYPVAGYFKFFLGAHGARGRGAVIAKITTDGGVVGWGQSVPSARWSYETLETCLAVMRDYYASVLVGRDPCDIAGAERAMDEEIAPAFSTGMPLARAGIEIALNDLVGKLAGKPLAELWGRPRGGPIVLSWTLNPPTIDDLDGLIDEGRRRGYENFNIKVAPDPVVDVELARRVRARVPRGFLWADANGGYDLATALEAAPKLSDAGVDVLEAPLRPNKLRGYQALKKQGALPILMDEGIVSAVELEEFIGLGMLDGIAMKPSRCGGLASARRQLDCIAEHGLLWLGSGLSDPDIALAASLVLYGAYGLTKPAALNGPQFVTAQVLRAPLVVKDGRAVVPSGPGLGIDIDEEKVRDMAARTQRVLEGS
jgi:L-alanine-DL-glutamate epimerase-like enolase superfamily enzyme